MKLDWGLEDDSRNAFTYLLDVMTRRVATMADQLDALVSDLHTVPVVKASPRVARAVKIPDLTELDAVDLSQEWEWIRL